MPRTGRCTCGLLEEDLKTRINYSTGETGVSAVNVSPPIRTEKVTRKCCGSERSKVFCNVAFKFLGDENYNCF